MPLSLSDAEFSAVQAARRAYPFTPARRLPASFSRGAGEASRRRSRARAPPGCGLAEAIRRGSAQRNWAAPSSVAPGERLRRPNRNTTATPTIYRLSSVLAFSHGPVDDAPLVVIDDPIIFPCTAVLPQLASTLIEPPSPVGEKKWR